MVERFIVRSLPRLNEVFGGGIPRESMIHIYGPYQAGKTLLIYQLIYELVGQGLGNALYIDTEASFRSNFSSEMGRRFRERFGNEVNVLDVKLSKSVPLKGGKKMTVSEFKRYLSTILDDLGIVYDLEDLSDAARFFYRKVDLEAESRGRGNIYLLDRVDLSLLLKLMDVEAEVERKGQKTEVRIKGLSDPTTSPLSKFIRKYRVMYLVLDSIGMLVKNLAVSLSDLPARAVVTNLVVGNLIRLASEYGLVVFATNHESKNPTGKGFHSFYGGYAIGYGFKYSLYLSRMGKSRRRLVGERSPLLPEFEFTLDLVIKDDGFHEVSNDGTPDEATV